MKVGEYQQLNFECYLIPNVKMLLCNDFDSNHHICIHILMKAIKETWCISKVTAQQNAIYSKRLEI